MADYFGVNNRVCRDKSRKQKANGETEYASRQTDRREVKFRAELTAPRKASANKQTIRKQTRNIQRFAIKQCFSTAGPRHGTGLWHQLYRAARGSPRICHFSFLSNFHE